MAENTKTSTIRINPEIRNRYIELCKQVKNVVPNVADTLERTLLDEIEEMERDSSQEEKVNGFISEKDSESFSR